MMQGTNMISFFLLQNAVFENSANNIPVTHGVRGAKRREDQIRRIVVERRIGRASRHLDCAETAGTETGNARVCVANGRKGT